ncbi:MAG TPA: nucleotidyltransferase domain-containing protein, partial [Terriglobia bacterium]|nr:nucleotidyltransferase domain-containing protein [Terriglobia bacterium]
MQALGSYSPESQSSIAAALRGLEDEHQEHGLEASSYVGRTGRFARFVWPDWPAERSVAVGESVRRFSDLHGLQPVEEGSSDWNAVFHGWRSDPVSAEAIAGAFRKQFGGRLLWVLSQKDIRGRIGARGRIRDLARPRSFPASQPLGQIVGGPSAAEAEVFSLELSWKDSFARPRGPLSDPDMKALLASTEEVFDWAARRIQPVLDALLDQLKELYGERFRGLFVFGSYAKPDAGIELPEDSDLDVALILSDFESAYKEIDAFSEITS